MKIKKLLSVLLCALIGASFVLPVSAEEKETHYVLGDGNASSENQVIRGVGTVSTEKNTALLMDYREETPDQYWEIMELLFGAEGAQLTQITVSAEKEPAPCQLLFAKDALSINPELPIALYLDGGADFKGVIDKAQKDYGIEFDYAGASGASSGEILSLSIDLPDDVKRTARLDKESGDIPSEMLSSSALMEAVDAVDIRGNGAYSAQEVRALSEQYGKEIWMGGMSGGLSGHFIKNQYDYGATFYQLDSFVYGSYSWITNTGVIYAAEPWSGYYEVSSSMWEVSLINGFLKGMSYVSSGCTESYITCMDKSTMDYAFFTANFSEADVDYELTLKNIGKMDTAAVMWENSEEAPLSMGKTLSPVKSPEGNTLKFTVKSREKVVITTTAGHVPYEERDLKNAGNTEVRGSLALPYTDDFRYKKYPENYLKKRGNAPRYFQNMRGSFGVSDGRLVQTSGETIEDVDNEGEVNVISEDYGICLLGDNTWKDYTYTAKLSFTEKNDKVFAGIGVRCRNVYSYDSDGVWLRIYPNGEWSFECRNASIYNFYENRRKDGKIEDFKPFESHEVKLTARGNEIRAELDGTNLGSISLDTSVTISGRAGIESSGSGIAVEAIDVKAAENGIPYVVRVDESCEDIKYSSEPVRQSGSAELKKGDTVFYTFNGRGIAVIGGRSYNEDGFAVKIDGKDAESTFAGACGGHQAIFYSGALKDGEHTIEIKAEEFVWIKAFEVYSEDSVAKPLMQTGKHDADFSDPERKKQRTVIILSLLIPVMIFSGACTALGIYGSRKRKRAGDNNKEKEEQ